MTEVNTDLKREREKCTFKIDELTHFSDGGADKTLARRQRENMLISNTKPLFDGIPEELYLGHKEKYENAVQRMVIIFDLVRKHLQGASALNKYRDILTDLLVSSIVRDGTPLAPHYVVFIPAILHLGTTEQHEQWIPKAWNCKIIGGFAQTELGHGTFIRGLETTATYDAHAQEFVLHCPTITAYKWWPGGLGQTSNYCIVIAQLYTKGKCHGIHSFIVQLRDEETHMPLAGIKVGDIGPKFGLNSLNNGYLGFDNVRIPRNNLLMRHAQVLEDGTYVKSPNSKLNYGSMLFVRVMIVFDTVNFLSKAVTIATRYSAVRRQSQLKSGEPERQILDYVTQQHKLFIGIAASYAIKISAKRLWGTFEEYDNGNLELLPELHASACCLKAVSTADAASYVEQCRLACGGHGYMLSSALPALYASATASCTYEGDNTVLLLQTARFLLKTWQQIDSGKLTPTVEYLRHSKSFETNLKWENTVEHILHAFKIVSMRKIALAVDNMQKRIASGMSVEDAWNKTSVQLVAAAEAHCRVMILSSFVEEIRNTKEPLSVETREVMQQLVDLYAIYWALEKLCDLLQYACMTERDVGELREWYEDTLCKLRPNAVGLVDAFDIHDDILHSTLGASDGRVYERMMEEVLKNPLNAEPVNYTFHKYLKPFMQGKL